MPAIACYTVFTYRVFGGKATEKGLTIVPLRAYLKQGRVKVEIGLARAEALDLPHRVRNDAEGDAMQPRRQRRLAPKPPQLSKRPNERFLRELSCELAFAGEPKGQPKDPRRVRVVQLARG